MRTQENQFNRAHQMQTPPDQSVPKIDLLYCFADPMDTLHFNLMYEQYVTNAPDTEVSSYLSENMAKRRATPSWEAIDFNPFEAIATAWRKWKNFVRMIFKGVKA